MAEFFDIRDRAQFGKINAVSAAGVQIGPIIDEGNYQVSADGGIVYLRHKSSTGADVVTADTGLTLFQGAIEMHLNAGDYIGAIAKTGQTATVRVHRIG